MPSITKINVDLLLFLFDISVTLLVLTVTYFNSVEIERVLSFSCTCARLKRAPGS